MNTLKRCSTCSTVYTSDLCPRCLAGFAETPAASSAGAEVPETVLQTPPSVPMTPSPGSRPAPAPDTEVRKASADPKNLFGKYVLLRQIGAGGMGVVFKAWQSDLRRVVAVKFIRGIQAEQELERFQREAQLAATLSHPGIAPIFESGAHEGKHFFAMQYVEGLTLDRLLAGPAAPRGAPAPNAPARPPLRRIVEVLAQVAEAVDFAHEKGVVHRDLKPANIMVDGRGHSYVMDFGLAKSVRTGSSLTGSGHAVGTPSYMAPEQAQGDHSRIGPRTDVYALGAILYEVATGRPPFVGENLVDVLVDVAHKDPVAPRRLNPKFPPDLETIAMKALEKDPDRRFATAEEFAADLRRWLEGEPILARPSGQLSRLLKRVRRHKLASAGVLALVAGLAVAGLTLASRAREKSARAQAIPYHVEATAMVERAEKLLISPFRQTGLFQEYVGAAVRNAEEAIRLDPTFADAHYILGRALLRRSFHEERWVAPLSRAIELDPNHLQAHLFRGMGHIRRIHTKYGVQYVAERVGRPGVIYRNYPKGAGFRELQQQVIADLQAAARLNARGFEKALLQGALALVSWTPGQPAMLDQARQELERAATLSPDDPFVFFLLSRVHLMRGDRARAAEEAEKARTRAQNDTFYMHQSALLLLHADKAEEALPIIELLVDTEPTNAHLLSLRGNIRARLGYLEEALADYRKSVELDPAESSAFLALGWRHYEARRYAEALAQYDEGLKHQPQNIELLEARGACLVELGRLEEAEAVMDRVVSARDEVDAYANRGAVRSRRGRHAEALEDFRHALRLAPGDGNASFSLGLHYYRTEQYEEAEQAIRQAIAAGRVDGETHLGLAMVLFRRKRFEEALSASREALKRGRNDGGARYWVAECLYTLERWEEAAAEYREAIRLGHPEWHSPTGLGECLVKLGRHGEAVAPFQEAIRRGRPGPDGFFALADALAELKRWEEAEEAYTRGLERQKDHAPAFMNRGRARCEQGRLEDGLRDYLEALRLKPDDAASLREVALIHFRMRNLDDALVYAERAIASGLNTVDIHTLHGEILRRRDDYGRADESLTRALAVDPRHVPTLVQRARVRHQLGRKAEGYADLETALGISPGFPKAIGQRGILLVIDKRYAEAARDLRRAVELEPGLKDVLASYLKEAEAHLKDE
jgi:tetratricopeptide (TPR) repeat protein/predicted Ser/Thr protein kinase